MPARIDAPRSGRDLWLAAGGGLLGLAVTVLAVFRWGPEAIAPLPSPRQVLERSADDARRLGMKVAGAPRLGVGFDVENPRNLRITELDHLVDAERDPAARRRLLGEFPPVRRIAQFPAVVAEDGVRGSLVLEYGAAGRLIRVSFAAAALSDLGAVTEVAEAQAVGARVAAVLLGGRAPEPEVASFVGVELLYRVPGETSGVYVNVVYPHLWTARWQAHAHMVSTESLRQYFRPGRLLCGAGLTLIALVALVDLGWRIVRRRVGLAGLPVPLAVLGGAMAAGLAQRYFGQSLLYVFEPVVNWTAFALAAAAVWATAEAELRETWPGSVEHLDRIRFRLPVRATGRGLLVGTGAGAALGGLLAAAPAVAALAGGGYGRPLTRLPDDPLLGPIGLGTVICALTAFAVGGGARLAGRRGAVAGAVVAAFAWKLAVPAAPPHWTLIFGLPAALVAGRLLWRQGMAALFAAALTATALPTLVYSLAHLASMPAPAVAASAPLVLLLVGGWLAVRAPERREAALARPAYVSRLEQEARMAAELDLLRRLQLAMLPPAGAPGMPGIDAAWHMAPADTIGGDLVDIFPDASGRLWIAIADAAGHGLSCSIMTATTRAAVLGHAVEGLGPAAALDAIRPLFLRLRGERAMVTLLLAVWDPERRELTAASAGHPPLLVFDGAARELGHGGPPLGVHLPASQADGGEETLHAGGALVVVASTDGVAETRSPAGEPYGFERWLAALPRAAAGTPAAILEELLADVDRHRGRRPQDDDVTVLVVKIAGETEIHPISPISTKPGQAHGANPGTRGRLLSGSELRLSNPRSSDLGHARNAFCFGLRPSCPSPAPKRRS